MQVFVKTYGCSANTADSETLSGCLKAAGYKLAKAEADADLLIFNSCAVKGPTENRIINDLKHVPKTKKLIVAGCLPLISYERLLREVHFDGVVGPAAGEKIVPIVQRVLAGETVGDLRGALVAIPNLDLPRVWANPIVSVVPVNYGCLGSCAFCCVTNARGQLRSYRIKEVVARVEADVAAGAKELWITSQDTACYGRDIGTNLAELLKALVAVAGDFQVRVGMMTPNMVTPFFSDLVSAFENTKVFRFVHLPVQSGDDEVLESMRRFYTAAQFKETVASFRKACPDFTVSTDVICGFPGETAEAFENTLKVIGEVEPDIVNVSKFFARPKTAAWNMQTGSVDKVEIKRRSTEAAKLAKQISLSRNQRWLGWQGEILVDEEGKVADTWVGRNWAYKPVAVKCDRYLMGKRVRVKVARVFSTYLEGILE